VHSNRYYSVIYLLVTAYMLPCRVTLSLTAPGLASVFPSQATLPTRLSVLLRCTFWPFRFANSLSKSALGFCSLQGQISGLLCFHKHTNSFCRNPFGMTTMQIAGCRPPHCFSSRSGLPRPSFCPASRSAAPASSNSRLRRLGRCVLTAIGPACYKTRRRRWPVTPGTIPESPFNGGKACR
jgi:hypothetical protein